MSRYKATFSTNKQRKQDTLIDCCIAGESFESLTVQKFLLLARNATKDGIPVCVTQIKFV
jgi:hypothetical protein